MEDGYCVSYHHTHLHHYVSGSDQNTLNPIWYWFSISGHHQYHCIPKYLSLIGLQVPQEDFLASDLIAVCDEMFLTHITKLYVVFSAPCWMYGIVKGCSLTRTSDLSSYVLTVYILMWLQGSKLLLLTNPIPGLSVSLLCVCVYVNVCVCVCFVST